MYTANIRRVTPYTPGEQPKNKDVIKLNTNECPYPPSESVKRVLREMDTDRFRLYPDPAASDLVKAWADYNGLKENQVFTGVGSDDVLSMCFLAFFAGNKRILFPDITYSFYDVWCDVYRIPYERIPLDENFRLRTEDYIGRENGGIVIANPNAPTGLSTSLSRIEQIVAANPESVVIVDEAYVDFGGTSALPLIEKYENLVVVQTFSKSRAMAGLRVGFAMGNSRLIGYLNDVKYSVNSYTMNYPSIAVGKAVIEDVAYFEDIRSRVVATRQRSKKALSELGFSFPDSDTNFIFAKHESASGKELFDALRDRNIFVRYFNKPRISDYLRITIGTDEQMDILFEALREILGR